MMSKSWQLFAKIIGALTSAFRQFPDIAVGIMVIAHMFRLRDGGDFSEPTALNQFLDFLIKGSVPEDMGDRDPPAKFLGFWAIARISSRSIEIGFSNSKS